MLSGSKRDISGIRIAACEILPVSMKLMNLTADTQLFLKLRLKSLILLRSGSISLSRPARARFAADSIMICFLRGEFLLNSFSEFASISSCLSRFPSEETRCDSIILTQQTSSSAVSSERRLLARWMSAHASCSFSGIIDV